MAKKNNTENKKKQVVTTTAPEVETTTAPEVETTTAPEVETTTAPEIKQFKAEDYFVNVPKSKVVNLLKTIGNCVKNKLSEKEIEDVKNAVIAFNTKIIENNN